MAERPSNADLLYAIALSLKIVDPRTGQLTRKWQNMLNPPESDSMTATAFRVKNAITPRTDSFAMNPTAVPPRTRPDMDDETRSELERVGSDYGILEPPPIPEGDGDTPTRSRRSRGRTAVSDETETPDVNTAGGEESEDETPGEAE